LNRSVVHGTHDQVHSARRTCSAVTESLFDMMHGTLVVEIVRNDEIERGHSVRGAVCRYGDPVTAVFVHAGRPREAP